MVSKGKLIVFCGIDGAGKTSQIQLLIKAFQKKNIKHSTFKQPTDWYRNNDYVRRRIDFNDSKIDIRFMSLLSAADRLMQYETYIAPELEKGHHVIMDRYVYSMFSYMHARGLYDYSWLLELNKFVPSPDITFFLDIDPRNALERLLERDGISKKKEEQDLNVMSKVRDRFLELAEIYSFEVLDGSSDLKDIHEAVVDIIRMKFNCL